MNTAVRASALPSLPHLSVDLSTRGCVLAQAFLREDHQTPGAPASEAR
jgi:hypothetical protein